MGYLMRPDNILILGTNPYVEVITDLFSEQPDISFKGLVENLNPENCSAPLYGMKVHWNDDIDHLKSDHKLICSLGTTLRRNWIEEKEAQGFGFANLRHSSAIVSDTVALSTGTTLDVRVVISSHTKIGKHVRIGRTACIGHHTSIGDFSTIHPGAIISGNCDIGSQVTISTGAVVIDNITIGDGSVVAAGAVVVKDVPPNVLVAGVPAKVIKENYGPK